ncbi:hypothetical protein PMAYCL1PPCAC_01118, partial [Pristionchus mayeri]
ISKEGEKGREGSDYSGGIGFARFDDANQVSGRISAQIAQCLLTDRAVGASPSRSTCAVSLGCIH